MWSALLFTAVVGIGNQPPSTGRIDLTFDQKRDWPSRLIVQRGTVIGLSGFADPSVDTTFIVRLGQDQVALADGDGSWGTSWNTSDAPIGRGLLTVSWRRFHSDEVRMAEISLDVLDQSPFTSKLVGSAPNGDPLFSIQSGSDLPVSGAQVLVDGKPANVTAASDGTYRVSASGLAIGPHTAEVRALSAIKAPFTAGGFSFAVDPKLFFSDAKALIVNRTIDTLGNVVRVDYSVAKGLGVKGIDIGLGPAATLLSKPDGGQFLINCDMLTEGATTLTIKATLADGTVLTSLPRDLTVSSTPDYVKYRALSECGPYIENNATYLKTVFDKAYNLEGAVSEDKSAAAAETAWIHAAGEAMGAIGVGSVPEPPGLALADKDKIVPGLIHTNESWMTYGRIFAEAMADSWKPVAPGSVQETCAQFQQRVRDIGKAQSAVRDAGIAGKNMSIAWNRLAEGVSLAPLQLPASFGSWKQIAEKEAERLDMLTWVAEVFQEMTESLSKTDNEMVADSDKIRAIDTQDVFDEDSSGLADGMLSHLAMVLLESSRADRLAKDRDKLVGDGSETLSTEDQESVDRINGDIRNANARHDSQLTSAYDQLRQLLARFYATPLALQAPNSQ